MKRYLLCLLFFAALITSVQATAQTSSTQKSHIPPESRRSVEQTLLTFPEWYLVHSPAEYARYVVGHPAHGFPFLGHIRQLWGGYAAVTKEQLHAGYSTNAGYHVMILVLATSTTLEYSLRWAYENIFGRISWAASSRSLTPEDHYGATVAQDYVDFIRHEPWYLYDFKSKLQGLWTSTPWTGRDMLRKWERRYALTTEYGVKMVYAWLIEKATRAAYEEALMTTLVEADRPPTKMPAGLDIQLLRRFDDGHVLLSLPRYFGFKTAVLQLAQQGSSLTDIAGNRSVIFLTAWIPENRHIDPGMVRILFEQPMLTMPGLKRVGLIIPVSRLSDFLLHAQEHGLTVEHVHDY
ncbi:hypothetical protein [Herbaspirillum sp.]|uniref:hypothetical protein n=1 Tax=Herbaspirillum TaxID=963 RepID=UPI00258C91A3|nr:hypothetical protein [Herbaspirillum sp.]MCP3654220.1 hypothetical protein [Herbaspirillum sp.]MCP3947373.1 hypothetical protein [Herbaspirillum sp.]MCP4031749.1 hypothetical protein [Herbaspirillum sp.]MCP4555126.1 hypothetical protein [Herbaspirillum sp.]